MSKMLSLSLVIAGKLNSSFSGAFKKANTKVKDTKKSLVDMQLQLRKYEKLQKQGTKETNQSATAIEKLRKKYSQSVKTLIELNSRMQSTKNELKDLISQKKKGTISAEEFEDAQEKLKIQLKETGTEYNNLKLKTQAIRSEMERLADVHQEGKLKAEQNAKAYDELAQKIKKAREEEERLADITARHEKIKNKQSEQLSLGKSNIATGIQTAATVAVPVYSAIKFESSMADVKKVVDFETPQQFKDMNKDILNLSKKIPIAADGLASIVAAGGQAGIARNDLVKFAEDAAKMGVAFDITADEAGQMMAEWRTAFQLNQKQVVELADQINHLGNTTSASAPKISEVVQRIGPLGEVGGLVSGEIAALGASMVAAGTAPEVAATGIKNMILALAQGESATKSQKEAFKELGLDAGKMAKMLQTDAQGAIMTVMESIRKLEPDKQAAIMNDIFGSESLGAIAPLLNNLEMVKENFKMVGDASLYAGSMQEEFKARSETTENQLILLKNSAVALGITIGNTVLPIVSNAAELLSNAASAAQSFSEKHPTLTKYALLSGTAISGLAIGLGILRIGYATTIAPILRAANAARKYRIASKAAALGAKIWAGAQKALNLVMKMNPMLRVISLVLLLATVLHALYKKFEPVRKIVDSLWDSFKKTFPDAAKWMQGAYEKAAKLVEKIKEFFNLGGDKKEKISVSDGGDIPKYARGGILTRPHIGMVAEEGPEAVIPLDKSQRAYSLWQKAGRLLGVQPNKDDQQHAFPSLTRLRQTKESLRSTPTQNIVYNIEYAPVLSGIADTSDVKEILQQDKQSLFEQLKRIEHDRERLKFA